MKVLVLCTHVIITVVLTIVTQIGGLVYLLSLVLRRYGRERHVTIDLLIFLGAYGILSAVLVPWLAGCVGRVPLPSNATLAPHSALTVMCNRHYVTPAMRFELQEVADAYSRAFPKARVTYLDANFPFIDGFPLLPHRSHDDGRKVDLSFQYTKDGNLSNLKPSRSGYGYYESPYRSEYDQPAHCKSKGYWQYDFARFITLGSRQDLVFDRVKTKVLLEIILKRDATDKVFIEPHLKSRLEIGSAKCRYHGCAAVRHDDHIHYQVK